MQDLEIRKFDLTPNAPIKAIIIGRRDVGKTHLTIDLLQKLNTLDENKIICANSDDEIKSYTENFNGANILTGFDENIFEETLNATYKKVIDTDSQPSSAVVFDNCFCDNTWFTDKNIKTILLNGYDRKQSVIITMGYPLRMPPILQKQIDYIFIFREKYLSNRQSIWNNYLDVLAGDVLSFEKFNELMDKLIEPHECYVFNLLTKSKKLEDIIFLYNSSNEV